jgi:hypothetical protein
MHTCAFPSEKKAGGMGGFQKYTGSLQNDPKLEHSGLPNTPEW